MTKQLLRLSLCNLILNLCSMYMIFLSGKIVDALVSIDTTQIFIESIIFFILSISVKLLDYYYSLKHHEYLLESKYMFLVRSINKLLSFDLRILEEKDKINFSHQLSESFNIVNNFKMYIYIEIVPYIFKIFIVLYLLFCMNALLVIWLLFSNVFIFFILFLNRRKITQLENNIFLLDNEYNSIFDSIFLYIEDIKIMLNKHLFLNLFLQSKNKVTNQIYNNEKFKLLIELSITSIKFLFLIIIIKSIMDLLSTSQITVGESIVIYGYLNVIDNVSIELNKFVFSFRQMKLSKQRLDDLLFDKQNKVFSSNKIAKFEHDLKCISYKNYIFEMNNYYVIQGANGIGKTTLLKEILGLYFQPDISIDTINYSEINLNLIRENYFAYAPQSPIIFPGTFKENIEYYKNEATFDYDDIITDFELTHLRNKVFDFHNLDQLSGGEKQKISLIRVLISNKPVLIFDEPFNNLDKKSQLLFQEYIKQKTSKIIIIVSHNKLDFSYTTYIKREA